MKVYILCAIWISAASDDDKIIEDDVVRARSEMNLPNASGFCMDHVPHELQGTGYVGVSVLSQQESG